MITKSMSLEYEPASEPLHISVYVLLVPPKVLRGGISKVNFQETLSIFGDKCPQNGSKTAPTAPRPHLGYPYIGPFVVRWSAPLPISEQKVFPISLSHKHSLPISLSFSPSLFLAFFLSLGAARPDPLTGTHMSVWSCVCRGQRPLSSEHGACKSVRAKFWPWLPGKSPENLSSCSLFAQKRLNAVSGLQVSKLPVSRLKARCRVYMAHVRQSEPDSRLGVRAKFLKTFSVVPSSLRALTGKPRPDYCLTCAIFARQRSAPS